MKASTHPTYYPAATVTCACGNVFSVGSTKEDVRIELCAKCHPFYTGQQKLVDSSRRIEKFAEKAKAKVAKDELGGKKVKAEKRAAQKEAKKTVKQQSVDA
jgi:large subunit ribosomal protein L31